MHYRILTTAAFSSAQNLFCDLESLAWGNPFNSKRIKIMSKVKEDLKNWFKMSFTEALRNSAKKD